MADLDKNILITPSTGSAANPSIKFTGADNNPIDLSVLDAGTLSFSGSSGQLFSISDDLTGTIFSVNDISGIPSIEVTDDGTVSFAEYSGNVLIGTAVDAGQKLQVAGDVSATSFIGALTGNADTATNAVRAADADSADTATILTTPRTIGITGDITANPVAFDGSSNIAISAMVNDDSHNHTSLNGITSLAFNTEGTDSASISTTIEGGNTFFDFNMTDDNAQEQWRWRFDPTGIGALYNAMVLVPVSDGNANLTVSGTVTADSFSGTASNSDLLENHDAAYFAPQLTTYSKIEVDTAISNLIEAAPETLDTLNELAAALGDDPNFATTVTTSIGLKLDATSYNAADVLTKLKTVDGTGSGLDADLLDGIQATGFARLGLTTQPSNYLYLTRTSTAPVQYVRQGSTGDIAKFYQSATVSATSGTSEVRITNSGGVMATGQVSSDTGLSTGGCNMVYDATEECLNFVFS